MAYLKKLVMHGFKSFVRKTELPFTPQINVILGPNGSGKSNITDALCFVLGRLSIKSIRAAKASNLIFSGTKAIPPAREAYVELIIDNSDKLFAINKPEISIRRIVRKNGQSVYKINDDIKTRQEVLVLLAQAGIDPHGFNIILQGEIQNFVKMHTEERRKVIEEVSGISVYEVRKEKALRELEKTEERLKEISAILRERTAYLNNLEKERQQALRYKKLEHNVKRYKASIINSDISKKQKEIDKINADIEDKNKAIDKARKITTQIQAGISSLEVKIKSINETIKKSTGLEQEALNREIAEIRAELAGLNVKIENYEAKLEEIGRQKKDIKQSISENELALKELQKSSPSLQKKEKELEKKKKELEILEDRRKKFYMVKSELKSIRERAQDKEIALNGHKKESELLLRQIDSLSAELFDKKSNQAKLTELHYLLSKSKLELEKINKEEAELEKITNVSEHESFKLNRLKQDISKMDTCPLCKSKITAEHIKSIHTETAPKIEDLAKKIQNAQAQIKEMQKQRIKLVENLENINSEMNKRESDLIKLSHIYDKKEQIKYMQEKIDKTSQEMQSIEQRKNSLEKQFDEDSNIEQKYETLRIEVQEIAMMSEETLDSDISFKQRELERAKILLKQIFRDEEDFNEELKSARQNFEEKEALLSDRTEQEQELTKKFKMLIAERDFLQDKIRQNEAEKLSKENEARMVEHESNNLKIEKARVDAEQENLKIDIASYSLIEIIKAPRDALVQKLQSTQEILSKIGTVNLRSLEVYDSVKKEYDIVKDKAGIIEKEKEKIAKIIHEIDVKKKKTFMKTLNDLNELFSRNFAQLSTKGYVFLEVENQKEPFEAGVGIIVKVGQGKYFDVTSLSGGEQTIVALSLIFAIQEYRPYQFYVLDEVDAALDKRNSERLAGLLKKYMTRGQYIIVTHNDEVISSAANLYGVSMHDGVSKIVSLKV